jgi:serine/threonine protein kinase
MINDGESTQRLNIMTVGRYQLLRKIGQGGMGEVWLGEDPRLHRQVAIKTLPIRNQGDREFLQRFEREARAAAALNHPHILPVHDYGDQTLPDGQVITYIVMPYVAGGTLTDRVKMLAANGRLMPQDEAVNYLFQAAEAIDYAHGQNVLHRDIKPSNMLLRSENWLMLADFGIARIVSDQEQLTQAGVGIGTPEYMAPEQAQGRAEAASDNYSLAVIAYQLLTGQLPFSAETPYATTIQHIIAPPPPPRQINPNLSPAVEQVLLHGLAKEPAQRPPSAQAFVTELRRALTDPSFEATYISQQVPPTQAAPITPSLAPHTGEGKLVVPPAHGGITRRQILIGGGAAILLAGGLGTWAIASRLNAAPQPSTSISKAKPTPNPNAPVMTLLGHTQPISSLAWSPTAPAMLASAGKDQLVLLWNIQAIQQGQASPTQPKAKQQFSSAASVLVGWSPDGGSLAIGNSGVALDGQLVDTKADVYKSDLSQRIATYDDSLMTFNKTSYIQALVWAPSPYLITVSHPHEATGTGPYVFEFRDPLHPQKGLLSFHELDFAYALAASPDGSMQAIASGLGVLVGQLDLSGKKAAWKNVVPLLKFGSNYYPAGGVSWSPDGKYVAAINNAQFISSLMPASELVVWNWQSNGQTSMALPRPGAVLTTLAWSPAPSSTLIAAGSKDGAVYIWNFNSNATTGTGNSLPIRTLRGLNAEITALAWSTDGRWLAAGYKDTRDSILIWKL